jgi:hypothetical protein
VKDFLIIAFIVILGYWLLMALTGAGRGLTYPSDEYHPGGYNELFYGD